MYKTKTLDDCKKECHTRQFMASFWLHENVYSFCADTIEGINDSLTDIFLYHKDAKFDTLPISWDNPKVHVTMSQSDGGSVSFYIRLYMWNSIKKMYEEFFPKEINNDSLKEEWRRLCRSSFYIYSQRCYVIRWLYSYAF